MNKINFKTQKTVKKVIKVIDDLCILLALLATPVLMVIYLYSTDSASASYDGFMGTVAWAAGIVVAALCVSTLTIIVEMALERWFFKKPLDIIDILFPEPKK